MKENKGITLIALVITIIVLLILAGVSIAMLTGDNSILKNARVSGITNSVQSAKEQIGLKVSESVTNYYKKVYVNNAATTDTTSVPEEIDAILSEIASSAFAQVTYTYGASGTVATATASGDVTAKSTATPPVYISKAYVGIKYNGSDATKVYGVLGEIDMATGEIDWSETTEYTALKSE